MWIVRPEAKVQAEGCPLQSTFSQQAGAAGWFGRASVRIQKAFGIARATAR
jgi:hypothetical protein